MGFAPNMCVFARHASDTNGTSEPVVTAGTSQAKREARSVTLEMPREIEQRVIEEAKKARAAGSSGLAR